MKQEIAARITNSLTEGKLPCASAFKVARGLKVSPQEVRQVADELGIKISQCQLGLFGYGTNRGKALGTVQEVGEDLQAKVREKMVDGRLPCAVAWDIAHELKVKRIDVTRAAEASGVRITRCQLGCFD